MNKETNCSKDNLILSTVLVMLISHYKEFLKLTFR